MTTTRRIAIAGCTRLSAKCYGIRRHVIVHSWVKDFHVHRLRHTFACRWLDRGGSIEAPQKILGHSTIKLTERYGVFGRIS